MIKLNWLFFAFALIVAACSPMGTEEPSASLDESASAATLEVNETCGGSTSYDLLSGNSNPQQLAGSVTISNDETTLSVEITAKDGVTFNDAHLEISCEVPDGKASPGNYTFNDYLVSFSSTSAKFEVPLTALPDCGDPNCLNMLVHLSTSIGTAMGGPNFVEAGGGAWFNYLNYCVNECYEASGKVEEQLCEDESTNRPLGGVTVNFKQGDNEKSTTTDADGSYSFTKIGNGPYTITVAGASPAAGYTPTGDSENNDFVIQSYSISGTVNVENCGVDEGGLAGLTVTISGSDETATTDAEGNFSFDWLSNGTYTVAVEGIGSDDVTVEGNCDGTASITKHLYGFSGIVYNRDCDGVSTPAGAGIVVTLSNGKTTETSEGGSYSFSGLEDGSYTVSVDGANSQPVSTNGSCASTADLTIKPTGCVCYGEKSETAWANGPKYNKQKGGNWAMYFDATSLADGASSTVNLIAGQTMDAGDVKFTRNGSNITIEITLAEGWTSGTVHIQGYGSAPSGNPSPGQFKNKGTQLTWTIPYNANNDFFGVHVEVSHQVVVPCAE